MRSCFVLAFLPGVSLGEIVWSSSNQDSRRLGVALTASHTDKSDADCIVGGYDEKNPLKIYIGGPCSEMTASGPSANFRWVEMQTVFSEITSGGEVVPFKHIAKSEHVFAEDKASYANVGVLGEQFINMNEVRHAAMFLSTTSYLSKGKFSFTTNDFVISKANKKIEACVVPCCEDPGDKACECKNEKCPTKGMDVVPGSYKFSILAAAFDREDESDYKNGTTGTGWEKAVADYGGAQKKIQGNLHVYQVIDFTNMKADTLLVKSPDAKEHTYSKMGACTNTEKLGKAECPVYGVKSVTVKADKWSGEYAFPLTFNLGTYKMDPLGTTPGGTRKVQIQMIKPSVALMKQIGLTGTEKVAIFDYVFKLDGIEKGNYMVYDPTVTSAKPPATTTPPLTFVGGVKMIAIGLTHSIVVALVLLMQ